MEEMHRAKYGERVQRRFRALTERHFPPISTCSAARKLSTAHLCGFLWRIHYIGIIQNSQNFYHLSNRSSREKKYKGDKNISLR